MGNRSLRLSEVFADISILFSIKIVLSKYDQDIPQSQTEDKPIAPQRSATQPS